MCRPLTARVLRHRVSGKWHTVLQDPRQGVDPLALNPFPDSLSRPIFESPGDDTDRWRTSLCQSLLIKSLRPDLPSMCTLLSPWRLWRSCHLSVQCQVAFDVV